MKNLLLSLFLFLTTILNSQTVIEYDNMETSSTNYLSAGWWTPAATTGWFNNASVSPTLSAVIYGSGNGSSAIEQDWYSMPTVSGLDPNKQYKLKFRVASYSFSSPTAATRGLDISDYLSVQVSSNGGTYVTEMRILGNTNATWPFTSSGVVNHTTNGSFTNSAAPTGDVYTVNAGASTTTSSTYTLTFPQGLTSIAIDFYCRVNSAGEEWWLDNIELIRMDPLPVEMYSFIGYNVDEENQIEWSTASEHDSYYFNLERSIDGENWVYVNKVDAAGNSNTIIKYSCVDKNFRKEINYYRLTQVDFNGASKVYGPIMVDNRSNKIVVKCVNSLGQEVSQDEKGLLFLIYNDGTVQKIFR
jgi:hypothetical protein